MDAYGSDCFIHREDIQEHMWPCGLLELVHYQQRIMSPLGVDSRYRRGLPDCGLWYQDAINLWWYGKEDAGVQSTSPFPRSPVSSHCLPWQDPLRSQETREPVMLLLRASLQGHRARWWDREGRSGGQMEDIQPLARVACIIAGKKRLFSENTEGFTWICT